MDPFVLMENFSRAKRRPLLFPPPCPAFCPMMASHSPAIHNATKGTRILTGSLRVTLPVPSVSLCSVSIQPFFFFFCRDLLRTLVHPSPFVHKPVGQKYFHAKQDSFLFPCSSAHRWASRPPFLALPLRFPPWELPGCI